MNSNILKITTVACMATALAGGAHAASVTVQSVSGSWTSATPADTTNLNGIGTNEIRWGTPSTSGGEQSGYRFDGVAPPPVAVNEGSNFDLGTFTHFNSVINAVPDPSSIETARLAVTFDLLIEGIAHSLDQVYDFTHWETSNSSSPCADGGEDGVGVNVNGCADRVQAVRNDAISDAVTIDGVDYVFDITGFDGFSDADGIATFWTTEDHTNEAVLSGIFRTEVAQVPLPAAGGLLLLGLGCLGAVGRRRRASA